MKTYSIYDTAQVFKTHYSSGGLGRSKFYEIFIFPKDKTFELHGQAYLEFGGVVYFVDTARKKIKTSEDQDDIKKLIATGKLEKYIYRLFIKSNFDDDIDDGTTEQEKGNNNE